jgi:3-hydroxyisobutyrate dehydrogenase-like beta-hydroxyacid dehydrogenase
MAAISSKDLGIALAHGAACGVKLPMAALATQYTDAFLR